MIVEKEKKLSLLDRFKNDILSIDPVSFSEKYLTLDGGPFTICGNGYKPFADMYRYIGIKALNQDSKPVVFVKGRQVGATTMALALEMYFMASGLFGFNDRPSIRVLHCFPNNLHVSTFTKTKLNPVITNAIPDPSVVAKANAKIKSYIESKLDKTQSTNQSLQFKQFIGGNYLRVESTGLDADRLRGGTCDIILYDEVQDTPKEAISNANKMLSQAKYGPIGDGVQFYFGTPKQKGTNFWDRWNASNKNYYHLGCESCKQTFPLYTPGSDDWENIWLYGFIVKCVHCGHEQDKRQAAERGKWIPLNKDEDCAYIGYHLNQLYMPHFTKEKILSEKPENNPDNTERAYQNEVLGEFFFGESTPITLDEIREICADHGRKFARSITITDMRRVYAGFDWGKKNASDVKGKKQIGQSYSSGVILTAEGPKLLSIQFATLLKKNDPASKKAVVEEMMKRYRVNLAVGDIGYAEDLMQDLQSKYGDIFLASRALDKLNGNVKFIEDFPKEIRFDRNYYIDELIRFLKGGNIRFPYGDFESVVFLSQHCASIETKTTMNRFGEPQTRYVKGSTPNDGFMALLNAFLAYKFELTQGFTIKNPHQMKEVGAKNDIPAILGYIPRRM